MRVESPLSPRHSIGLVGMWEREDVGRVGLEYYFTGAQRLDANPYRIRSKSYSILGLLAERQVGPVKLFLNGENLTGVRQTKFDPLVLPVPGDRRPLDGGCAGRRSTAAPSTAASARRSKRGQVPFFNIAGPKIAAYSLRLGITEIARAEIADTDVEKRDLTPKSTYSRRRSARGFSAAAAARRAGRYDATITTTATRMTTAP